MAKSRQSRLRRVGLARARQAAGLTQEAFAALAGVEVSTVVRWESGCTTPLPGKRPRIARALGIGLQDLERLLSPGGSRGGGGGEFPTAGFSGAGFSGAGSSTSGAVSAMSTRHAEDRRLAAITSVRAEIARLTFEYEARPTTGLVVRAAGLLTRVEGMRGADQAAGNRWAAQGTAKVSPDGQTMSLDSITTSRWRRDLDIAEAETCLLVGRLLWDAAGRHDPSIAEDLFDRAARCAGRAGDSVLQATAVLRSAFLGLYGGDPRAGIRRCVQAAAIAAPVSQALFALARLHAAEGHALLGHAGECDRALAAARTAMTTAATAIDDSAPDTCPPRTHQRLSGAAYLALGRHAQARAALTAAAADHEPGKVLAVILGQLALACLREGDTEAALRHLRSAVELAAATRSPGALAVAARAARELMSIAGTARGAAMETVDRLLAMSAAV